MQSNKDKPKTALTMDWNEMSFSEYSESELFHKFTSDEK